MGFLIDLKTISLLQVFLRNCDTHIAERDMISFEKDTLTKLAGADGPVHLTLLDLGCALRFVCVTYIDRVSLELCS